MCSKRCIISLANENAADIPGKLAHTQRKLRMTHMCQSFRGFSFFLLNLPIIHDMGFLCVICYYKNEIDVEIVCSLNVSISVDWECSIPCAIGQKQWYTCNEYIPHHHCTCCSHRQIWISLGLHQNYLCSPKYRWQLQLLPAHQRNYTFLST